MPASSRWDFFTNYGRYMPRVHCLTGADGEPDWLWIGIQLVLLVGVVLSYVKIYQFWRRTYLEEEERDRNHTLMDLANIFLWCAVCGYGLSIVIFFWPAYRLLAISLAVLNYFSWRFAFNIEDMKLSLSARRLQRELEQSLVERTALLEQQVAERTAALEMVTFATRHTRHPTAILAEDKAILWCNQSFETFHGADAGGLAGSSAAALPTTSAPWWDSARALLERGEAGCVEFSREVDGQLRWFELELEWVANDEQNRGLLIQRDITLRRAAKRERDHVFGLINASEDLVRSVSATGVVLFDNSASQEARSRGGDHPLLAGRPVWAKERFQAEALPGARATGCWIGETALLDEDGNEQPYSEMLIARSSCDGMMSISSFMRDITELQQAREAAEQASRAKGRFLAVMSHEIRTPLNGVLGALELLSRTALSPRQQRLARLATSCANGLLQLINNVLDFSQMEAGGLNLSPHPFCVQRLLNDTMAVFQATAEKKGLWLRADIGVDVPDWLRGDDSLLRQVLVNLIGNAIKFTHQGGVTLRLAAEPADDGLLVRFSIIDTGPGIAEEGKAKLFKAFSQLSHDPGSGTGLGLFISKQIVGLMDGQIWVGSKIGVGSTFSFTARLHPAAPPPGEVLDDPDRSTAADDLGRPLKVLVAEDNEVNQLIISEMLETLDVSLTLVGNGAEAVEQVAAQPFDLVLMDCQMPICDGLEATRQIRAAEADADAGRHTMIVALTASAIDGEKARCLDAGMDAYLRKPIDLQRLSDKLDSVRRALASREAAAPSPAPAPAPPAPPAPAQPSAPPLDVDRLMEMCMGRVSLANRVLGAFLEKLGRERAQLLQAAADGDDETAGKLLHHLRGGAFQIGALALGELCGELRRAGRYAPADIQQVADEADRLLAYLDTDPLAQIA